MPHLPRLTRRRLATLAATAALGLLALALVGCGNGADGVAAPTPGAAPGDVAGGAISPSSAVGPGISVSDALGSTLAGPLLVNGMLLVRDGEVRLCEALAESFPPQCGGDSLLIEGLALDSVDGLTSAQGVIWSDGLIQILGDVRDGVLTVRDTIQS